MNNFFKNKNSKDQKPPINSWSYNRTNYYIFILAIIIIIVGYIIMYSGTVNSFQSLTLAPSLLFLGYIILIPLALLLNFNKKDLGS